MTCWECKKQTDRASMVHYVYMDKYYHEPIKTDTRDICKECYPKLKFDGTHHIQVFSPRGKQLQKGRG